jgi:NAD(P)H-flavin reductase/ferredoxin
MWSWFKREAPRDCQVRLGADGPVLALPRDEILLAGALARGIDYPHNCRVGTCGQCKTRLISGQIKPMMDFALSPLTAAELRDGYVLACQSKVRSDLVIHLPEDRRQHRHARIASVQRLPGDVMALQLALERPLAFRAGQYAELSLDGPTLTRAYSFAHAPREGGDDSVGFLIRRMPGGAFSDRLWAEAAPGLPMRVSGPFGAMGGRGGAGDAHADPDIDADALCVAGGTGLAPVVSIVEDRLRHSSRARFLILLGLRRAQDQFAAPILERLEIASGGRVRSRIVLSDEPADSAWRGARGPVTDQITPALLAECGARTAYLCGNAAMVQAGQGRLRALGWSDAHIHTDAFVASGTPAAVPQAPIPPLVPTVRPA